MRENAQGVARDVRGSTCKGWEVNRMAESFGRWMRRRGFLGQLAMRVVHVEAWSAQTSRRRRTLSNSDRRPVRTEPSVAAQLPHRLRRQASKSRIRRIGGWRNACSRARAPRQNCSYLPASLGVRISGNSHFTTIEMRETLWRAASRARGHCTQCEISATVVMPRT